MGTVAFKGRELYIGSQRIATFDHAVADAFENRSLIIVLLDPNANLKVPFPNLLAVDEAGRQVWVAKLPTYKKADVYYKIASRDPLVAYSFSCYDCKIDPLTGKILETTFYK